MHENFEATDDKPCQIVGLSGIPFPELGSDLDAMKVYYEDCMAIERLHAAKLVAQALANMRAERITSVN